METGQLTFVGVFGQKNCEKRRQQVVDALNVTGAWVPHGPDVENALKYLLHDLLLKYRYQRVHAWNVVQDLEAKLGLD